jgi:DNA-binding SARP family transcriptional activator/predicted ATPase
MHALSLNLLGRPEVRLDGAPLAGFATTKVEALLYYLACRPGSHPREELANLLWGETPETKARRSLTQALSSLRKLVGDVFIVDRLSVGLDEAALSRLDVAVFEALVAANKPAANVEQLEEAVALYRGDFLEGLYVKEALAFEEWQLSQRERLRVLMLAGLDQLVAAYVDRPELDIEAGLAYARRLLALDPWRESAHRQLMWLLARSGQREAALTQYETCRQTLAEELGVEPTPETTALYERLKGTATVLPRHLPPSPNRFVGRERELGQIARHLADPACRLVTLVGPGGIGKTRLALEAARAYTRPESMRLEPNFAAGLYFVPLASLQADPDRTDLFDALVSAIAEAVALTFRGSSDLKAQLLNYLRPKALLLIFDNVEHLLTGSGAGPILELLLDLLRQAPRLKLLVTSRERLNLQQEWVIEIGGLAYPEGEGEIGRPGLSATVGSSTDPAPSAATTRSVKIEPDPSPALPATGREPKPPPVAGGPRGVFSQEAEPAPRLPIADLQHYSAVALFLQRAAQVQAGFTLSNHDEPHLVRICRLVEGLPLGLELAAGWTHMLSCAEIAAEIERNADFLETPWRDLPQRHRSLRAVFDQTWRMLSKQERDVFCKLSIFRGGFEREAAQRVAGATLATLTGLANKSLVRRSAEGRYDLHELIRQYAVEKLWLAEDSSTKPATGGADQAGRGQRVWERYSSYYLNFVSRQEARLRGSSAQQAVSELRAELDNLRQAWQWAVTEGRAELLEQAASGLSRFFDLTGLFQEGQALFGRAAAYLQAHFASGDPSRRAQAAMVRLWVEQARLLNRRGLSEQSVQIIPKAADLARQIQNTQLEAIAYHQWGETLSFHGEPQAAQVRLEQALQLARSGRLLDIEAEALRHLGIVMKDQGDYHKATRLYKESLACFRKLGDRRGESLALNNLGIIAHRRGFYAEAQSAYEQGYRGFCEIEDLWGQGIVLNNLAELMSDLGNYTEAQTVCQQGLRICREIKDLWGETHLLNSLGNILRDQGDFIEAQGYYERCLQLRREIEAQLYQGETLAELALLMLHLSQDETARDYAQQAARIAREAGSPGTRALALTRLGQALVALNRLTEAADAYQEALELRRELGEPHRASEALAGLAQVWLAQGDLNQAQAHVDEVLAYLDHHQLVGILEPFRLYLTCYRVLQAGQDPRATDVLATAHRRLQERAAKIEDDRLRHSFLENVPAHRELVREFQKVRSPRG